MTIIVNFIVLPLVALLGLALVGELCYAFASTVFYACFTSQDIVTYRDAHGYPDRRGIRVARFNIPFLGMTAGETYGEEYYINQMEYDKMTR